ncbi:glycosyl hydrolase family 95 catalytic domain-containing protein [Pseudovibrio ascidiaceicola]|uniref:glycosyl hydrolase family 95 catalytic domain-containing protein n=1 Tax=Pseudovibrio ascidiaceicola TaxID=285279 RepID=UPI003D366DBF
MPLLEQSNIEQISRDAQLSKLRRNKVRYTALPQRQQESILLGSGLVGTMLFQTSETTLQLALGRADVYNVNPEVMAHRKPLGHCELTFSSKIKGVELSLDLAAGVLSGTLQLDEEEISLACFCHALNDSIVVDVKQVKTSSTLTYHPAENPQSSRIRNSHPHDNGPFEQAAVRSYADDIGAYTSTMYQERGMQAGEVIVSTSTQRHHQSLRHFCRIEYDRYNKGQLTKIARTNLQAALNEPYETQRQTHEEEWAKYAGRTLISLPDEELESYIDFQFYKLRCLTRPDGALIDLQGVWFDPTTPWPGVWHNLNSQLTYWICAYGNRSDLMKPLIRQLQEHEHQLAKMGGGSDGYNLYTVTNVDFCPPGPKPTPIAPFTEGASIADGTAYHTQNVQDATLGNFLWLVHNLWLAASYEDDQELLQTVVKRFLKKGIQFYQHHFIHAPDRSIHLPESFSPEYKSARNCNYDLAVLKWAISAYLTLEPETEEALELTAIQGQLVDFPYSEETGYLIGDDVALTDAHRHYSHLLMVYPFYLCNMDQPDEKERIRKSVDHWQSFSKSPHEPHEKLVGYSFTGAASLYAAIGEGDLAHEYLRAFLDTNAGGRMHLTNTQYYEHAGVDATTVEVPLTGATAAIDMLLQSWGGKIRLFPAIPPVWKDAAFFNLPAHGGYLISAVLQDGKLAFLSVKAKRSGRFALKSAILPHELQETSIHLEAGKTYVWAAPKFDIAAFLKDDQQKIRFSRQGITETH